MDIGDSQKQSRIEVTVPVPDKATHPNGSHGHWSQKSKAKKQQRADAYWAGKKAMEDWPRPPLWKAATIKAVFYLPGKRSKRSDGDNLIAWLKASADGLQDAGIIGNDGGLIWMPPEQVLGDAATERKVVLILERQE